MPWGFMPKECFVGSGPCVRVLQRRGKLAGVLRSEATTDFTSSGAAGSAFSAVLG